MYHPPSVNTSVGKHERSNRPREREESVMRRLHVEYLAAERARGRAQREAPKSGAYRLTSPAAALWALVTLRR
jgi:hypothetical protein